MKTNFIKTGFIRKLAKEQGFTNMFSHSPKVSDFSRVTYINGSQEPLLLWDTRSRKMKHLITKLQMQNFILHI